MTRDLTGKIFSRLTVIKDTGKRDNNRSIRWLCRCICGNLHYVRQDSLINGNVRSCGCLNQEERSKRCAERNHLYKHGEADTRLHHIWSGIKTRCFNSNRSCWKYYGGKGITVCDEWLRDFVVFKNFALSHGYTDDLTIDRIDNDGNYEPSNVQFISRAENTRRIFQNE